MSKAWRNGSTSRWREIRKRIIQSDQVCQLCGQDQGQMHVDHIVPKSQGGSDMDLNL
jgi:5-methylcytosine-specific restriction endonuclease McrA